MRNLLQTGFTPPTLTGHPELGLFFKRPLSGRFFFTTESTKLRRFYNLGTATHFYMISPLKRDRISRDRGLSAVRMKIARWVVRLRAAVNEEHRHQMRTAATTLRS